MLPALTSNLGGKKWTIRPGRSHSYRVRCRLGLSHRSCRLFLLSCRLAKPWFSGFSQIGRGHSQTRSRDIGDRVFAMP